MSIQALRKAAQSGDGRAQLQLGIALMTGQGVPAQDLAQGRDWLARAADNGSGDAQRFLGIIFLRGMDVVPDFDIAVDYLARAAGTGDAEACFMLAGFLGGARDDWFDAGKAREYLEQAAAAGLPRAQAHLAYTLLSGALGEKDAQTACEWFIEAASNGDPGAMLALSEFCQVGYLLPRDTARAFALARKAADSGWQVAGEFAVSLARENTPRPDETLIPGKDEISLDHYGSLPAPELEALSWQPRAIRIRNFLSNFECAEIVNAAAEHLMPSFIVDAEGSLGKHQVRSSHEVRLRPGLRNIVMNTVERRMAEWSHFPLENGEFPLVLRYEKTQSFEQHYDYFIPEKFVMGEGPLEFGGQRIATQLIYLNEDFKGGETRFDNADLVVRPERGMCMIFHNVKPDHNVDPSTRHTGVAIESGVKWLLSRWIREIPFDQSARDIERDRYKSA